VACFLDRAEVEQSSQRSHTTICHRTLHEFGARLRDTHTPRAGSPESRTCVSHCLGWPLPCKLSTRLHFCKSLVKKARIGRRLFLRTRGVRSKGGDLGRLVIPSMVCGRCSGRHRGSCILSCVCGSSQPNRNLSNRSIVAARNFLDQLSRDTC